MPRIGDTCSGVNPDLLSKQIENLNAFFQMRQVHREDEWTVADRKHPDMRGHSFAKRKGARKGDVRKASPKEKKLSQHASHKNNR